MYGTYEANKHKYNYISYTWINILHLNCGLFRNHLHMLIICYLCFASLSVHFIHSTIILSKFTYTNSVYYLLHRSITAFCDILSLTVISYPLWSLSDKSDNFTSIVYVLLVQKFLYMTEAQTADIFCIVALRPFIKTCILRVYGTIFLKTG